MECNKDEATRAKEIAENKFTAKDIFGARKSKNCFLVSRVFLKC